MGRHKAYAESLVAERAAYVGVRSPQVAVFDEELARLGWGVDPDGELAPLNKLHEAEAEAQAAAAADATVEVEVSVDEPDDAKAVRRPKERAVSKPSEKAVDPE